MWWLPGAGWARFGAMLHRTFTLALLLALLPAAAPAAGEIEARVLRVIDGDTIEAEAEVWPGITARALVRVRGVDTPELRGRCPEEKAAARAARAAAGAMIGPRGRVTLRGVETGKYAGRVVAGVTLADGRDLAAALIAAGHGRVYGGGKRFPWCADPGQADP